MVSLTLRDFLGADGIGMSTVSLLAGSGSSVWPAGREGIGVERVGRKRSIVRRWEGEDTCDCLLIWPWHVEWWETVQTRINVNKTHSLFVLSCSAWQACWAACPACALWCLGHHSGHSTRLSKVSYGLHIIERNTHWLFSTQPPWRHVELVNHPSKPFYRIIDSWTYLSLQIAA